MISRATSTRCSTWRHPSPSRFAPSNAKPASSARRSPNYFRQPYGPGWALVGDAGYNKDFITAQGMHDAFPDAEGCATALDEAFSGARPFDDAMAAYQAARDAQVLPMYELTTQLTTPPAPPPELQTLLGAIYGHQAPMDEFAQVMAGVLSPCRVLLRGAHRSHARRRRLKPGRGHSGPDARPDRLRGDEEGGTAAARAMRGTSFADGTTMARLLSC